MINSTDKRQIKLSFPLGLYLKQLFAIDTYVTYYNPFNFWRTYRINHLETCHELNTAQYLERCFQLDWRLVKPIKNSLAPKETATLSNSLIKQPKVNQVYISRPRIKLKYRGVSYYPRMQSRSVLLLYAYSRARGRGSAISKCSEYDL